VELEIDRGALERPAYHEFVNTLAKIAVRFSVDLRIPATISDKDLELICLLARYVDNGTFKGHFRFA
jgi:hypothetical protein